MKTVYMVDDLTTKVVFESEEDARKYVEMFDIVRYGDVDPVTPCMFVGGTDE